jgi:hypothetical protein
MQPQSFPDVIAGDSLSDPHGAWFRVASPISRDGWVQLQEMQDLGLADNPVWVQLTADWDPLTDQEVAEWVADVEKAQDEVLDAEYEARTARDWN